MFCEGAACTSAKVVGKDASDVTGTFPVIVEDGDAGAALTTHGTRSTTYEPGASVRGRARPEDTERPTPSFGVWVRSEAVGLELSTHGDLYATAGTLYYCRVEAPSVPRCYAATNDLGLSAVLSVQQLRHGSDHEHVIWGTATRTHGPDNFFLAWMKTRETKLVRCIASDRAPTPECKEITP